MRRRLTTAPDLPLVVPVTAGGLLIAAGWLHWSLYIHGYRSIPRVGPLFALDAVTSAAMGVTVVLRRELVVRLAAALVVGAGLAAFVASRTVGLLSFREVGWTPAPQAPASIAAEAFALVVLFASFAWDVATGTQAVSRRSRKSPRTLSSASRVG
jgi:hypothetical protein